MDINAIVDYLNGIAWGPWMLILLVGTGVYISARTGFVQFSKFGYVMKNTLGKLFRKQTAGEGEVTPFQALSTALAATVGTGNIAGVTGAIAVGGPGAVFWMWISALFVNTGFANWYLTGFTAAINVTGGTSTISPGCTPASTRLRCRAEVPLWHAATLGTSKKEARSFSSRVI